MSSLIEIALGYSFRICDLIAKILIIYFIFNQRIAISSFAPIAYASTGVKGDMNMRVI